MSRRIVFRGPLARSPRSVRAVAFLVMLAALWGVGAGTLALAGGSASLTVEPSTRLGNGQFVKASWNGFGPGQLVFFRQCDAAPSDLAADCAPAYRISAPSDSNGRGATYLPVTQGEIAAQGAGSFFCDEQHACSLAALTDPADLSTAVFSALTFAPSADACPDPGDAAILGGGSSTAGLAFDSWSAIVCQPPSSLPIGYSVSNSPNGRLQYIAGNYWFAGTATPFSYDQQVQLYEAKRGYGYAPVTTSGLVLASNIHEQNTDRGEAGPLITDLKLTPGDVARIFTGQVDNWHLDRRINNLNATHKGKFPPLVQPMVRGDNSASTYLFTSWLSEVAPEELPNTWPGPTESFPVGDYLSPTNGKETAQALALSIAAPEEIDLFQFGYIGYVDSSMASYYGLAPVKIKNAAGKFVEATPEALAAGLRHMKTNPDGTTVTPDFQTKDPKAYPLPVVSYLVAPTNKADEAKAGQMAGFIRWAVSTGQQDAALPEGYLPLPTSLRKQANEVADTVEAQNGKPVVPVEPVDPDDPDDPDPPGGGPSGPTTPTTPVTPTTTPSNSPVPTSCDSPSASADPSASAPPSASASPKASASPSGSASPTASATPSASATPAVDDCVDAGPEPDRPEFPATSSNAAGLIVPSLAALAALGIAAGPGIQASANGSDLGNAVRRRLGRFRR